MSEYISQNGIQVAGELHDFINRNVIPGTGVDQDSFWSGFADLLARFAPKNAELLAKREQLQQQIDEWHIARKGTADRSSRNIISF